MANLKAQRLLDLCIVMRLSHRGLSIGEIQSRYDISRRTAERLRDAVWDMSPLEERKCFGEDVKRWKLEQCNIDLFCKSVISNRRHPEG